MVMPSHEASQSYVYRRTTGSCPPSNPSQERRKHHQRLSWKTSPFHPLATTHELGPFRATQIFPSSSSHREGDWNREAGANQAWWASFLALRQSRRTSKADFPAEQWSLSMGKHPPKLHFILSDQFLKGKAQAELSGNVKQSDGEIIKRTLRWLKADT